MCTRGHDRLRGVTVRRFATSRTRDMESSTSSDRIFNEQPHPSDEMEWLKQQGPWSPGLIDYRSGTINSTTSAVLHLSARADGDGHAYRAIEEPSGARSA